MNNFCFNVCVSGKVSAPLFFEGENLDIVGHDKDFKFFTVSSLGSSCCIHCCDGVILMFLDGGYFSKVTVEGKVIPAENCCQTKKQAEQSAAKAGLIAVGVKDPETVAKRLLGR